MAKRKRLEMPIDAVSPDLETKSGFSNPRTRMPIADVAGDTAGRAALEEIAREMTAAEREGRVVKKLSLEAITVHHLSRDRMVLDEAEMETLEASVKARGQQTPVEVVVLSGGKYGLISGFRRLEALRRLKEPEVLAVIKQPSGSQDAYQAMVEENEIRANLSFYERANIAVVATVQGVFPTPRDAVKALFAHAPKAKRSKILKFVTLRETIGASLSFPAAIPEHLGLAMGQAIEADRKAGARISAALKKAKPKDAAAERKVLEAVMARPSVQTQSQQIGRGLVLETKAGRAVLKGRAVDEAFVAALKDWAATQAKS